MTYIVARPCCATDLIDVTPAYKQGWGPPLPRDPIPWSVIGELMGFHTPAVIHADSDWDSHQFEPGLGVALRYVLVPRSDDWELRIGRTEPESPAGRRVEKAGALTSGSHRHMFSQAEQTAAERLGLEIRAGYIFGIEPHQVIIGSPWSS